MIAIVNIEPIARDTGWHRYELRINKRVIVQFKHRRQDSLATCLRRAANAAAKHKRNYDASRGIERFIREFPGL